MYVKCKCIYGWYKNVNVKLDNNPMWYGTKKNKEKMKKIWRKNKENIT